jgi:hypothetical protein
MVMLPPPHFAWLVLPHTQEWQKAPWCTGLAVASPPRSHVRWGSNHQKPHNPLNGHNVIQKIRQSLKKRKANFCQHQKPFQGLGNGTHTGESSSALFSTWPCSLTPQLHDSDRKMVRQGGLSRFLVSAVRATSLSLPLSA